MTARLWAASAAIVLAGATIALATLLASGIGAVASVVLAVLAVLLVAAARGRQAVPLAVAALAIAAGSLATVTIGDDVGRALLIASPPVAVAAAATMLATRARLAVAGVWAGATVAGPIRALFDDPFLDARCAGCRHNAAAVLADRPTGLALATIGILILAASTAAMIRRSRHPVLTAGTAAAALGLLPAIALDPVLVGVAGGALAALAVAASTIDVTTARRRLADLENGLRSGDDVVALLRRESGDPHLTIAFPDAGVADAEGLPVRSADRTIAVIRTPSIQPLIPLLDPPGPELVMTLVGAHLDADLDARIQELREARSRVVVHADEERRLLERDLHDGAQQHVLALGFDLRAAIVREGDPARRAVLQGCVDETMHALDDLRDIAHGVYPPLLAIAGLGPALRALGSRTPVPIVPGALPGRMPQSVERVAYLLVSELAFGASGAVEVSGEVVDDLLRFTVRCADSAPGDLLRERIAALDGTIRSTESEEDARWELTVPCG